MVEAGDKAPRNQSVELTVVNWNGLRCKVAVSGHFANLSLDIRRRAGDPSSSVVVSVNPFKANGTASVVVENEELQGQPAFLVLLSEAGTLVAEGNTVIGGE
jgi:hypothetical protein